MNKEELLFYTRKVRKWVITKGDTVGWCEDASIKLARMINGIVVYGTFGPVFGRGHAWVRKYGYWIDVTADQFNNDKETFKPIIFDLIKNLHFYNPYKEMKPNNASWPDELFV